MTAENEQRRFTRIPFPGEVTVDCGTGPCCGALQDISIKGVLMARPADWAGCAPDPGAQADLTVELESGLIIEARGTIAHVGTELVGVEFTSLPVESAAHLRRLVEMNLGTSNLLEREFDALVHAHEPPRPA